MTFSRAPNLSRFAVTAVATVLTASAMAEQPATTLATLLDKQAIQDMLVDYYGQLGSARSDFGTYYIADGVLDVNGVTGQGEKAIEDLYKKIGAGTPKRTGIFRMMLTNVKVVVNGDTATADSLWTGVNSETLQMVPKFIEQGTEHDELVKRNGKWLFKHRIISSDGGMQEMFEKTHKPNK
jgi:hypothetical protein